MSATRALSASLEDLEAILHVTSEAERGLAIGEHAKIMKITRRGQLRQDLVNRGAPAAVCTSHIGKAACQVPWFSYHHASYARNVSPA